MAKVEKCYKLYIMVSKSSAETVVIVGRIRSELVIELVESAGAYLCSAISRWECVSQILNTT